MEIFKYGLDDLLDEVKFAANCLRAQGRRTGEIGSSDVSCSVRAILRRYHDHPDNASESEFQAVRNGILNHLWYEGE
jgi:hypothetical protein